MLRLQPNGPLQPNRPLQPNGRLQPGGRVPPHQDVFWASVQNCLTAVANVSKACWGEDREYRKERKPLRRSLEIKGDSPLKPMATRHNFEHFDERIDEWFATRADHMHIDRMIGPPDVIGGVPDRDMFRVFDTTTADVVLWGARYPLKSMMDEIARIYPLAKTEGDKPYWDELPSISGGAE
jgi:hypothetical protein